MKPRKKYLQKGGSFLTILIINIAIALLIGGRVIWVAVFPQVNEPMAFVKVKPVPPPPKTPSKGGGGAKSLMDPTVVVVPPPSSAPNVISSMSSLSSGVFAPPTWDFLFHHCKVLRLLVEQIYSKGPQDMALFRLVFTESHQPLERRA